MSVLVIGGSGYIGQATLKDFELEKIEYIATYTSNKKSNTSLLMDIMDSESINKCIDSLPTVSGVVFCYQVYERMILEKYLKNEDISSEIESLNLKSFGIQLLILLNAIKTKLVNGSNIVFMGSLSNLKSVNTPLAHAVGKSSIPGLLNSLSKEWGKDLIKINSIVPGVLNGGLSHSLKPALKEDYIKHCSLKRYGNASEVAATISWFIKYNTYITGQQILLDGGL